LAHAVHEILPILSAVEIVHHQKTALEQVLAQSLGLGICECPGLHLDRVNPWIVEEFVGIEANHLLRWASVYAGQPVHGDEKLAVGFRIVARPRHVPSASAIATKARHVRGVSQPRPVELGLDVGGRVVVAEAEIARPLGPQCRAAG
jgi:hypothetical protein